MQNYMSIHLTIIYLETPQCSSDFGAQLYIDLSIHITGCSSR